MLKGIGMPGTAARRQIAAALINARNAQGLDANDNIFYTLGAHGRLDATHLKDVLISRDGMNEVLASGQHGVQVAYRQVLVRLLDLAQDILRHARTWEQDYRASHQKKTLAGREFKQKLAAVLPTLSAGSQNGYLRQMHKGAYDATGVVDGNMPGFESATKACLTVASQTQQATRKSTCPSDHLTAVGTAIMSEIETLVGMDVSRAAPDIAAASTAKGQKRVLSHAMSIRLKRLKRFNMYAADPNMIGDPTAVLDAKEQSDMMFNQTRELVQYVTNAHSDDDDAA